MLATRELQRLNNEAVPDVGSTSGGEAFWYTDHSVPLGLSRRGRLLLQTLASSVECTNDGGFLLRHPCDWALTATGRLALLHTRCPWGDDDAVDSLAAPLSSH